MRPPGVPRGPSARYCSAEARRRGNRCLEPEAPIVNVPRAFSLQIVQVQPTVSQHGRTLPARCHRRLSIRSGGGVYHEIVQHTAPDLIVRGTPAYSRMGVSLFMAGFSTFALMYDVQPLLPLFTAQFGVNAATSSLAVSLTTGTMALAFIPAAVLSDRIGRRSVMIFSLMASAALTLLSAVLPGWTELLAMRAAIGLALAGLPSVAMAYVSEEVHPNSIGAAMGLYIAASAFGGMAGRLGMAFMSQYTGWREAIGLMGAAGLAAGLGFAVFAPKSRAFGATHHDLRSLAIAMRGLL